MRSDVEPPSSDPSRQKRPGAEAPGLSRLVGDGRPLIGVDAEQLVSSHAGGDVHLHELGRVGEALEELEQDRVRLADGLSEGRHYAYLSRPKPSGARE
jgi:hypothetical protein